MAITVTSLVGNGDKTASASLAVTLGATGVAAGETILVGIAADNAGTNGVNAISSVTDSKSNTYTQVFLKNQTGGATNDGTTVALYVALATSALVANTDTVTVNFSPNVTAKAFWVAKMADGNYNSSSSNTASGAGTAYTSGGASASITSGDIIFGVAANESGTVPANDTDTTNGSWSNASQATGGTGGDGTKQAVSMSWKVVTATGTQTFNGATGANTDWAAGYAIFPAKVTTTITPAAASLTTSLQTSTLTTTSKPAVVSLTTSLKTPSAYQMPLKPAAASLTTTLKTPTLKTGVRPVTLSGTGNAYENYQSLQSAGVTSQALNWSYGIPKIGHVYYAFASASNVVNNSASGVITDNAGNTWVSAYTIQSSPSAASTGIFYTRATSTLPAGSTWTITHAPTSGGTQNLFVSVVEFAKVGSSFTVYASGSGTASSATITTSSLQTSERQGILSAAFIKTNSNSVFSAYPSDMLVLSDSGATYGMAFELGVSNNTDQYNFISRSWTFASSTGYGAALNGVAFSPSLEPQTPTLKTSAIVSPAAASLTATRSTAIIKSTLKPMRGNGGNGNAYQNYQTIKENGVTSISLDWAYGLPKAGRSYVAITSQSSAFSGSEMVTDNAGNTWENLNNHGSGGAVIVWYLVCESALQTGTWTITFDVSSSQNLMLGVVDLGPSVDISGANSTIGSTTNSSRTDSITVSGYSRVSFLSTAWIKKTADSLITAYPADMLFLSNSGATDLVNHEWGISNVTTTGLVSRSWTLSNSGTRWYDIIAYFPYAYGFERETPTLTDAIRPAAASLTASGQTPTITNGAGGTSIAPAAGSLTLAGQTDTLTLTLKPAAVSLTTSLKTPTLKLTLKPAAASLTASGQTPTLTVTLRPAAAALTLDGQTPEVIAPSTETVTPDAASLTLAGQTPTTTTVLSPAAAALVATGQTPSATTTLLPDAASLTVTGETPGVTVTATETVAPAAAELTLTGETPATAATLPPAAASLALEGETPLVATVLTPAATGGTLTGLTPTTTTTLAPAAAALKLAASTPDVSLPVIETVPPGAASLALAAETPTLAVTLAPAAAGGTLSARTPTTARTLRPAAASLALAGATPALVVTVVIAPAASSLTLAGQTGRVTLAVRPAAGALAVSGSPPRLLHVASPAAGALTLALLTAALVLIEPVRAVATVTGRSRGAATVTGRSATAQAAVSGAASASVTLRG